MEPSRRKVARCHCWPAVLSREAKVGSVAIGTASSERRAGSAGAAVGSPEEVVPGAEEVLAGAEVVAGAGEVVAGSSARAAAVTASVDNKASTITTGVRRLVICLPNSEKRDQKITHLPVHTFVWYIGGK
jgi:hypothetical protein